MKNLIKVSLLFFFLAFVFLILIKILFPSEKEKILRLVEEGRRAVERENLPKISEILSPDYLDAWGNDYYRIIFLLRRNFQIYDEIKVFLPLRRVVLKPPFAECSLLVRVFGRDINYGEELIYSSPFLLFFIKEDKRWYIISAKEK